MRNLQCYLKVILLIFISKQAFSQTSLNYSICEWDKNKKAAVSLTFDDAIHGQFAFALPLLNAYGIMASFFITTNFVIPQMGSWNFITQAAKQGHEIGNHSKSHPPFAGLSVEQMKEEIRASNQLIEAAITPKKCTVFAYPNGSGGGESKAETKVRTEVKNHFIGARATQVLPFTYNSYDLLTPDAYYKINSQMITQENTAKDIYEQITKTISAGGWYVPTYHGIENGWIIVSKNMFITHLKVLDSLKNDLWIAPFGDVLRYHRERNCAVLKVIREDSSAWKLALTDTLSPNSLWNQPLTIEMTAPSWEIKEIRQSNTKIPFSVENGKLIFNSVPDLGMIILLKN